jgi:hypothetical protein
LGNLIVLVVFTAIWPVNVAQALRRQVSSAISALASLMRLEHQSPLQAGLAGPPLQMGFAAATTAARGLMANAGYERITLGHRADQHIDTGTLSQLETIMLVFCVILNQQSDPAWPAAPDAARQAVLAYHDRLASWLESCVAWVKTGVGGGALEADIPAPPRLEAPALAARAAWYGVLDRELRAIMSQIMHRPRADG